jgi:hypothetical protein
MNISPIIIGDHEGTRADVREKRKDMYRSTVFSDPSLQNISLILGPYDEEVRNDPDVDLSHSFTREHLLGLAEQSLIENPDSTLTMRRAFPTFKLYFFEDDTGPYREHLLPRDRIIGYYDDFYSYNSIKEIRLVRSRKNPADLLVITMTNISGLLDGRKFASGKSPVQTEFYAPGLQETELENPLEKLILKQGLKVQLLLGNRNNPKRLEEKFIGEVVEISKNEDSPDLITFVAQSYGTELVLEPKGITTNTTHGFGTTAELLHSMMCSPELVHFGRYNLNPQFNPAEARSAFSDGTGRIFGLFDLVNSARHQLIMTRTKWFLANNPADDNIYAPDPAKYESFRQSLKPAAVSLRAAGETIVKYADALPSPDDLISYYIFRRLLGLNISGATVPNFLLGLLPKTNDFTYFPLGVTIWEMFKEMELRHPGHSSHPRPYGQRMTMFFGLPSQRYWATEASREELIFLHTLDRTFRRYRDHELSQTISPTNPVNYMLLVSNFLWASLQGYRLGNLYLKQVAHNVELSKVGLQLGKTLGRYKVFRRTHVVTSDHHILVNNIRASEKNTYNAFTLKYAAGKTYTMKADDNIPDEKIRMGFVEYPNCRDVTTARRYCIGLLMRSLKDVYKGFLLVTGMNVDVYDLVLLFDNYSEMYGGFEVEQVVDIFTRETGWVTEITPDMCVYANEYSTMSSFECLKEVAWQRYKSGATSLNPIKTVSMAVDRAGPAGGYLAVAQMTPLGAILSGIGGYYFVQWTQERQPILIHPLILKNRPFIDGVHGFKRDGVFANLFGNLIEATDEKQKGWKAMDLMGYMNNATIPIAQDIAGQGAP